jgi:hypothetical protein
MTHFEEKQFYTSEGQLLKFFHTRNKKKIETLQNKEKTFSKQSYISFANPKLHEE